MAFNFNWSPLIADTNRVRDMLTSALNKPSKPPIIVDDILVNELNLGSTPPSLEILEIGDLAEDRFRGIFKMSYAGDAYLTLQTKVQVNPLKTYLSTKPSFTSPQPLAACSGLTMPVQITLSDIRLSGFVILVFSKQKGITLVFRNDPLEALKVSSTFDSIPFVRDFLQNTIEKQLRTLFVEDLPAIIHRLSLKVFNPELALPDDDLPSNEELLKQAPIDPFASPSLSGADGISGDNSTFSLDPPSEIYATFSQKNLLRLAALNESQRTLSLFTPGIRDAVFRAWTTSPERLDAASTLTAASTAKLASLSRIHTSLNKQSTWSSTASETSDAPSIATRPSLVSMNSAPTIYSLSTGRPRAHRKKKHRVVDLRKKAKKDDDEPANGVDDGASSVATSYEDSKSFSGSRSTAPSLSGTRSSSDRASQARDGELETPPKTPERKPGRHRKAASDTASRIVPHTSLLPPVKEDLDVTPRASLQRAGQQDEGTDSRTATIRRKLPRMPSLPDHALQQIPPRPELVRSLSDLSQHPLGSPSSEGRSSGGILEQAWMNKIASEVAKRIAEEKSNPQFWHPRDDQQQRQTDAEDIPPAYAV